MDDGHQYPDAAEVLLRDTYIDDVHSGAKDRCGDAPEELTRWITKGWRFSLTKMGF